MTKKLLIVGMILSMSQFAFAESFICKRSADAQNTQLVLIGDSNILVCQSPNSVNLNDKGMKEQYCAAGMYLQKQNSFNETDGARSGTILGQVIVTGLNQINESLIFEISFHQNSTGATANIKFSDTAVASTPTLSFPQIADYSCKITK